MAILTRVFFVRHGETDANRTKIIQGHLDTPLNAVGFSQAMSLANTLREVAFGLALSSDLKRAADVSIRPMGLGIALISYRCLDGSSNSGTSAWCNVMQGQRFARTCTKSPSSSFTVM